jgi:hypothetical protein
VGLLKTILDVIHCRLTPCDSRICVENIISKQCGRSIVYVSNDCASCVDATSLRFFDVIGVVN